MLFLEGLYSPFPVFLCWFCITCRGTSDSLYNEIYRLRRLHSFHGAKSENMNTFGYKIIETVTFGDVKVACVERLLCLGPSQLCCCQPQLIKNKYFPNSGLRPCALSHVHMCTDFMNWLGWHLGIRLCHHTVLRPFSGSVSIRGDLLTVVSHSGWCHFHFHFEIWLV